MHQKSIVFHSLWPSRGGLQKPPVIGKHLYPAATSSECWGGARARDHGCGRRLARRRGVWLSSANGRTERAHRGDRSNGALPANRGAAALAFESAALRVRYFPLVSTRIAGGVSLCKCSAGASRVVPLARAKGAAATNRRRHPISERLRAQIERRRVRRDARETLALVSAATIVHDMLSQR
eukprot:6208409-Pleurochrysis_carterae.AAC.1